MNIKSKLVLAGALLFSTIASAATGYSAYGGTEAEARQAVENWANGRAVSITCRRLSMGAPWQCTGTLVSNGGGEVVRVQAYGYSEANGTANAIAAWQAKTGSSRYPSYRCENIGVGPGWLCYAWG
ncbi:hypothetical protein ACSLBF_06180 [Pseudoalteromonas sp. T1lg65]|uniref:hypothetical protein n=1 Tax=Pseudoalteromonas sp. T1lg65 TaxID=2077101 RepID=UPI003F7A881F